MSSTGKILGLLTILTLVLGWMLYDGSSRPGVHDPAQASIWSHRWKKIEFDGEHRHFTLNRQSELRSEIRVTYKNGDPVLENRTLPAGGRARNIFRDWDELRIAGLLPEDTPFTRMATLNLQGDGSSPDLQVVLGKPVGNGKVPVRILGIPEYGDQILLIESYILDRLDNPSPGLFENRPLSPGNGISADEIRIQLDGEQITLHRTEKNGESYRDRWEFAEPGKGDPEIAKKIARTVMGISLFPPVKERSDSNSTRKLKLEILEAEGGMLEIDSQGSGVGSMRIKNGPWKDLYLDRISVEGLIGLIGIKRD